MSEQMENTEIISLEERISDINPPIEELRNKGSINFIYSGFIFLLTSLILLLLAGLILYMTSRYSSPISLQISDTDMTLRDKYSFYGQIISIFLPPVLILLSSMLCALLSIRLLKAAGVTAPDVIPNQDYEFLSSAIKEGNTNAINEYIKLSSLSGLTGNFTKLGLSGLPLATILLTIILSILGISNEKFFDLAQLTLGAFIGSYVQKQREEL
jgi:hypothetical protein